MKYAVPSPPHAKVDAAAETVLNVTDGCATAPVSPLATSLATLLSGHVLRDGEIVLLILKPSRWYILFSSLRFSAAVIICMLAAKIFADRLILHGIVYLEAGIFFIAGRVMFSILQWMGRLYVLTDLRILTLSGIFRVDIFDCPLRKVARTRLLFTTRERLFRRGTIEIIPTDEECPTGLWQTVKRPHEVQEQIQATIRKAKQGSLAYQP